jgi:hypothetical protein
MKLIVATVVWLLASVSTFAQGLPTLADVRKVTDDAMAKLGAGDLEGGLKGIKPLTIVPSVEFDAMLGQAMGQFPMISAKLGASLGYEFIREDRIGETLARHIYITKFDKHAMRWTFYLYKGKTGWVINTFRFDDKWYELF